MLDLEPAATTLGSTVEAIGDDQLDLPTPCDVPVAALLVHVLGLSAAFRASAQKAFGPLTDTAPDLAPTALPSDWRQQLPVLLDDLVSAWREPDAWEGMTRIAGLDMPGPQVAVVVNNELVLHAWDLATATGQAYEPHPANLEASWLMVSSTPDEPAARGGLFGPCRPVPDDAPLLHRVLAGAGRDPAWSPADPASR
jgi:uncharacterized protein (TIGR03086 family)